MGQRSSLSRRTTAADEGRDQRGFTLVELIVVSGLLAIVLVVILGTLTSVQKSETYTRGRAQALDDMRLTLDRMSRELRQATNVEPTPTATHIVFDTFDFGTPIRVTYDVSGTKLTRQVGTATPITLQRGLTSSAVFSYTPAPDTPQTVKISFSVKPSNLPNTVVRLEAEVRLRNLVVGE